MKFFNSLAFSLAAFGAATVSHAQTSHPQTPLEMALRLERDIAHGIGIFMPDTNRTFIAHNGTLALPASNKTGYPSGFLNGLAPVVEYGVTTWPVTLRVDDATGSTLFYNAQGNVFWEIAAHNAGAWSVDWVRLLRCGDGARWQGAKVATRNYVAALLRPSRVEACWVFVEETDLAAYSHARLAAQMAARAVRSAEGGTRGEVVEPELWVASFETDEEEHRFTAAWNDRVVFPEGTLEVWFSEDLTSTDWYRVKTVPVPSNAEDIAFTVTEEEIFGDGGETSRGGSEDLPRLTKPVPFEHRHDCEPEIFTAVSILDPGVSYTNVVCECRSGWVSPRGFFRLKVPGTEIDVGALPLWWKLFYGLDPWFDWDEGLDLNGDGHSILEAYLLGLNPIAPPNASGVTGAVIQYVYDDDDRLTHTFMGAEGTAVVRILSPAGNAEVQQERDAP